jgi:hypothetical protein
MEPLVDWRGNKIEVGTKIVWAVSQSSSVTLTEGIVEKIEENHGSDSKYRPYKLTVQPTNSHRNLRFKKYRYDSIEAKGVWEEAPAQPVRLTALERIVVVD